MTLTKAASSPQAIVEKGEPMYSFRTIRTDRT